MQKQSIENLVERGSEELGGGHSVRRRVHLVHAEKINCASQSPPKHPEITDEDLDAILYGDADSRATNTSDDELHQFGHTAVGGSGGGVRGAVQQKKAEDAAPSPIPLSVIAALAGPRSVTLADQPAFDPKDYVHFRNEFLEVNLRLNLRGWPCPSFRHHATAPSPKIFGGAGGYPVWARDYASDLKLIDLHYLHSVFRGDFSPGHPLLAKLFRSDEFNFGVAHEWACHKYHNAKRVSQLGLGVERQHCLSVIKTASVRRRMNTVRDELPMVDQVVRRSQRFDEGSLGGLAKVEHYRILYAILHFVDGRPTAAAGFYPLVTGVPASDADPRKLRGKLMERRDRLERWCARDITGWRERHERLNQRTRIKQPWHSEE